MMPAPAPKFILLSAIFLPGGCARGPTLDVFGSYFPAWMACLVIGLILTIMARLLLIGLGIDAHLWRKPVVYPCLAVFFTLAVWLVFFKG
ncbi:MAG: YtcA family lipoprotein [Verrucomicrobiae bacterium]|nr:YtcA family lipoprotein [Verrucomicrobiae bacterium]